MNNFTRLASRLTAALLAVATVITQIAAVSPASAQSAVSNSIAATSVELQSEPQPKVDWSRAVVESTMKRYPKPADLGAWAYAKTLFLFGEYLVWKRTGDPRYLDYIKSWVDSHVSNGGDIDHNLEALDYMLPGNLLLVLYQETQDEKYRIAAEKIRHRLDTYPRTSDGGLWHATNTSRKSQLWLDGTYMSMPFLVRYGQMIGDSKYANDEAAKQLLIDAGHLQDPNTGLLYHAYDESGASTWADPKTHHSAEFWGRAMGWYGMAIIDVLEVLPADHPKRAQLIAVLQDLIKGLAKYQDSKTGLWYQVVDKGSVDGNWLETSSSSMYTYIISMAVRRGYVDKSYEDIAKKGYKGVLTKLSIGDDGLANIGDICEGTNVADLAYYLARKHPSNDFHGLGAFLIMNEQFITAQSSMEVKQPRSKVIKLAVTNQSDDPHPAEDIAIKVAEIKKQVPDFDAAATLVTATSAATLDEDAQAFKITELPSQADDLDGDGKPDEIAFQIDLQPKQTRVVTISYGDPAIIAYMKSDYPPRTHAKFTRHFDGMGWESEVTAWRLYFDKRNAMDLWGKKKRGLDLEMFGAEGYKYQEESPIARDIYNVGNSLGSGSVGAWVDGKVVRVADVTDRQWRIVNTGPVRAIVEFTYKGWKTGSRTVDLTTRVTQWAGERGFGERVTVSNPEGLTLVAGLSRKPDLNEFSVDSSCSIGIWGHQVVRPGTGATESLPDQNLGLALLAPGTPKDCEIKDDPNNYLAKVAVKDKVARWYVLAAWDQEETDRISTLEDFTSLVKKQSARLEHPASVIILPLSKAASQAAGK
ncbi:MAG TPA: glycoside hydrolase family 88 protein [Terriglobales bacterium]|nr:glycoside hydrolase family 88 protein [Terriglobales bacterium]